MSDLAEPTLVTTIGPRDLSFDLSATADADPARYASLVESLRFLLAESSNECNAVDALVALLDALPATDPRCRDCGMNPGSVPVAAMFDGALFRIDARCLFCGQLSPGWFEASLAS